MKKFAVIMIIIIGLATPIFSQDDMENTSKNKHNQFDNYFGVSAGAGAMKIEDNAVLAADLGVTYGFYALGWLSLDTGILLHSEFYSDLNLLSGKEPMRFPMCFTIPFGIHFNIPNAEWLYAGVNVCINIPIADLKSLDDKNAFTQSKTFVSLPIDLGFDLIKPGRGGSRILFRIMPTFHEGGTVVPVGIFWQIYNWKVYSKKVEVNVHVDVPPPVVIMVNK